jgi:hypothetical protein
MVHLFRTEDLTDSQRMWISEYVTQSIHLESRPADIKVYHRQKQGEPRRYVWFKAMENIGTNNLTPTVKLAILNS